MVGVSSTLEILTEDTFVLLDALEADADAIRALAPRLCLEIGQVVFRPISVRDVDFLLRIIKIGHGRRLDLPRADHRYLRFPFVLVLLTLIYVSLRFIFFRTSSVFLCTDINPHAATCTARTGSQNRVQPSCPQPRLPAFF